MRDREPTVRSRELGERMRQAMGRAGLNNKEAARLLGWSESWVSRLLSGKRGGSAVDVAAFLGACRVKSPERDQVLALCAELHTPGWLQQHGSRLPKQLVTLVNHEDQAVDYSDVQPMLVPGLLQTGDYARAVISRVANVPAAEVEERVVARLARRCLFTRDWPPRFTFYLHESVLRLPVGGPEVMADQLHHLLRMSVRPQITLRVVPVSLGAHAATAGPFIFLEFAEFKPVVYLESETSCLFLEKPEEIQAYRLILAALAQTALSEEESRELIATLATELYGDREDQDDRA
ncbi:MAG: helix-turn-helix domain-containing protein [Pseudonocardiales bacterium]|nr:helix-turn-helix domain-containing protein [Pseudonocardiales bacterium]